MKKILFILFLACCMFCVSIETHAESTSKITRNDLSADPRNISESYPADFGNDDVVFQYAQFAPTKPDEGSLLSGYNIQFSSAVYSDPEDTSSDIIPIYCVRVTVSENVYDYFWLTPHNLDSSYYYILSGLPGSYEYKNLEDGTLSSDGMLMLYNFSRGKNVPTTFAASEYFQGYTVPDHLKNYYVFYGKRFDMSQYGYYEDMSDYQYDSYADFFANLPDAEQMEKDFYDKNNIDKEKDLPMLKYNISAKNVLSFPNIVDKKISINWSFADIEPYASDPMKYALEIIISAHFYPDSEGLKNCWDASKKTINADCKRVISSARSLLDNPYSFIYLKEGTELYESSNHIFATDELQDGYYLYIRSYAKDGSKSSNYKVYKCTTGGTVGQEDITYDEDGNEYELDDSDRDDEQEYSNEYDEDSSSSADEDPTGESFDGSGGYSFDTLYGNLKSMVNMLQGIPQLWTAVMSWLPPWFPTMIVTMLGLLIVIGVMKYIF